MQNQVLDPSSPFYLAHSLSWAHAADIVVRLLIAFGLGAFLSHRPWRKVVGHRAPRVQADTAQTQAIIAVAGTLLVVVIGDSLARAFGLVGLGTFIRFRAGVKDPRDVAVLFVMIGIGMACGLGLIGIAVVGTLFVALVLTVFDRFAPPRRRALTIVLTTPDPAAARASVRQAFPDARTVEVRLDHDAPQRACFAIAATEEEDALAILERLRAHGADTVNGVRIEEQ